MTQKEIVLIFIRRFLKAFIAGGIASLSVTLTQIPLSEFGKKESLLAITVGFISGGLMAVEKILRVEV